MSNSMAARHDMALDDVNADLEAYALSVTDRLKLRLMLIIGRILVSILIRLER
jgi:hypothetical protein